MRRGRSGAYTLLIKLQCVCVCSRAGELQTSKVVLVHLAERFCLVWGIENAWQQHLHLKLKDQKPMNGENLMVQALLNGCFDSESRGHKGHQWP